MGERELWRIYLCQCGRVFHDDGRTERVERLRGCLILGVLIAGVGTQVYSRIMKQSLGAWVNIFYLLSLFGLYRILIYSIAVHKRGRNPQKYYKNLISYGLLKFQGRSIVKNMLIVCLLIVCSLFACLYSPTRYMTERDGINKNPVDYTMSYPLSADELDQADIEELADQYDVTITEYHAEYRLLCLLVRNANRVVSRDIILNDLWDGTGNFVDDNTLSVYIRRLREKVETDASHPQHLITVRGFGYQWKEVDV